MLYNILKIFPIASNSSISLIYSSAELRVTEPQTKTKAPTRHPPALYNINTFPIQE